MTTDSNQGPVARSTNVYTLLLVITLMVLLATTVYMVMVNDGRFGYTMPFGDEYKASQNESVEMRQEAADAVEEIESKLAGGFDLNENLESTDVGIEARTPEFGAE